MAKARPGVPRRLARSLLAAALPAALLVLAAPAAAAQESAYADPMTTGSITPIVIDDDSRGSPAFRDALDLISEGRHAAAYEAARALPQSAERRAVQWAAIHYGDGAVDHDVVLRFAADAPDFATEAVFRDRAERALLAADPDGDTLIAALGEDTPHTVDARIALAIAHLETGDTEAAAALARPLWTESVLDRDDEARVLQRLGQVLRPADHWARAVMLLMRDRAAGTERIMAHLTDAQQTLARARIAVSRQEDNARSLLDRVDASLRDHPLHHFARAQLLRRAGDLRGAVAALDRAEGEVPEPGEWWTERRLIARQALARDDHETAYAAAAGYTDGPDARRIESTFHAGWIALSFLDDPERALPHFEAMRGIATLRDSIAQSNYWLGRTHRALGDAEAAAAHFAAAAGQATVYYGQLARAELDLPPVELRPLPQWQGGTAAFEARDLVRAIRLFEATGHSGYARQLMSRLVHRVETPGEMLLAARLAQEIGAHNLVILMADIAEGKGTPLDLFRFPREGIPSGIELPEVDVAAIYAVAHQESHFRTDAVSSAGARGLMQLMPGTARETAAQVGVSYSQSRLTSDPAYNVLLGATYLRAQLDRYSGSLALAAAAYNGGPGNANRWIAAHGDPRDADVDAVDWVELIPFAETRRYVQRVLGNYLVYRAREGDRSLSMADLLRRMP